MVPVANAHLAPALHISQAQSGQLEEIVGSVQILLDLLHGKHSNEALPTDGKLGAMQAVAMRCVYMYILHPTIRRLCICTLQYVLEETVFPPNKDPTDIVNSLMSLKAML